MKEPRFVVASVTGTNINVDRSAGKNSTAPVPTSYYVLDRAYCHQTVAAFAPPEHGGGAPDDWRRRAAEAKAAELNAWDAML